jgi:peroxiredoxin Q/BCP
MSTPTIGQKIDNFTRPSTGDQQISLGDFAGRNLVLYFYPKDSTPGCTTEGRDFTQLIEQFDSTNTSILGVSRDSIRRHENFKAKQSFAFDLLSDEDESLCRQFDVIKLKKLYGKEYLGVERSTFLIDGEGRLVREWRGVKVKGHAEEVLAAAQQLAG